MNSENESSNSSSQKPKKPRRSRAVKDPCRLNFRPEELYLTKYSITYDEENPMPRDERNRIRSKFRTMSDEKKTKYVKMAEANYDSDKFKELDKEPFTSYLNKYEIRLLWKSYGLPEAVSQHLNRYLCQEVARKNSNDLKRQFEEFSQMDSAEKQSLNEVHRQKWIRYQEQLRQFLDHLPEERLDDFYITYGKLNIYKLNKSRKNHF